MLLHIREGIRLGNLTIDTNNVPREQPGLVHEQAVRCSVENRAVSIRRENRSTAAEVQRVGSRAQPNKILALPIHTMQSGRTLPDRCCKRTAGAERSSGSNASHFER